MKYLKLFLLSISISLAAVSQQRPRVGLVLSGGAAKGFAHIGVLKVLEEAGMPIDYIGGTSMGSIVGGLYALGYSADSLEALVLRQDWEYLLTDAISRRERSINGKTESDRFILNVPMGKRGVRLPSGVISGQHIENLLTYLATPASGVTSFDSLPIPFLCVALNVDRARDTVFRSGDIVTAMRASMAIPSIFEPVELDGDRLVDGGVSNNYPADLVRQMGADILIGVDVGFVRLDTANRSDLFSLLEDALLFRTLRHNKENRRNTDIYIEPDLKSYGLSSFADADSIIALGEAAARAKLPQLKRLADSLRNLGPQTTRQPLHRPDSLFISAIHFNGLERITPRQILRRLHFSAASWVRPEEIYQTATSLYNSGWFNKVTYRLTPGVRGTQVDFRFEEKEEGSLKLGYYYDNNYKSSVFLNTTWYHLLLNDTRFSMSLGLGKNPYAEVEYYMDKGPILTPGLRGMAGMIETWNYGTNRNRLGSTYYFIGSAEFFLQSSFEHLLQLRLGTVFNHTTQQKGVGIFDPGTLKDNHLGFFSQLYLDTRDRAWLTEKGQYFLARGTYFLNGNLPTFSNLFATYKAAFPACKRVTLAPEFRMGLTSGDSIPLPYQFRIGGTTETTYIGNIPFPGYRFMEVEAPVALLGGLSARYRINDYLWVMTFVNGGVLGEDFSEVMAGGTTLSGYGAGVGISTPFGPVKVTLSKAGEYRNVYAYLQAGFWF